MLNDPYWETRRDMVASQLENRGISDPHVLNAMRTVPRHLFVPESAQSRAYEDKPVEIGEGQTISQPYMVAMMTELLEPGHTDRMLEIGTGSGYQSAILSVLCAEVHTVERKVELAEQAQKRLVALGYDNVCVHVGDGTLGWPELAPFDGIIVTAGGPRIPKSLKVQLAEGGCLVCPVGPRDGQRLIRMVRRGDTYITEDIIGCVFVPLIGEEGWA
ncbi:MAG: protein-L-isoaspartate O-methyltransferase [Candidatus Hydrogenedentota bacterium]